MLKNPVGKILLLVFVVTGTVFLNNYFLGKFLQNLFYRMAAEPGIFFTRELGKLSKYGRGFLNTRAVIGENEKLREENHVLLGQAAELEGLERENEFLRNELEVAAKLQSQLQLAEIFSIQRNAVSSTALINKGEKDGVKKSMAVITSGNILTGVVSEVFDNSALILLLDDPRSVVSVRFQNSDVLAETRGDLQNKFKIDQVTHQEEVGEGDTIITSGLDGLKKSLLVGRVSKVGTGNEGLFQDIEGRPMFDLSLGVEVFVILQ